MPSNQISATQGPAAGFGADPINSLTGDGTKTQKEKLTTLAKEFESIFVNQMLKSMRSTIQKSGLIDGGNAEEIYTSMMDEQLARSMAFSQHGGLSNALVEQLTNVQVKRNENLSQNPK